MKVDVGSIHINQININGRHRKDLGEIDKLMTSIREVGLLHPIVVDSHHNLIAGERRLEAFKRLHAENGTSDYMYIPALVAKNLDDALTAIKAERDENICRKDFEPSEAYELTRALKEFTKEEAKERQKAGLKQNKSRSAKFAEREKGETRDKLAEVVGMSGWNLEKIETVMEAAEAEPETYGDLPELMDKKSVDRAYKELTDRQRKKNIEEFTEKQSKSKAIEKTYNVIYADPPWSYSNTGVHGAATHHYSTMTTDEICDLLNKFKIKIDKNAVLFLWVTNPLMEDAFNVLDTWGFEYKTNMVWVKTELEKPGSGFYVRGRHELLFICTRGSFTPLDKNIAPPIGSVVTAPVQDHSRKPDEFYSIIERLYPKCSYIELFARDKARPGWEVWGNEAE